MNKIKIKFDFSIPKIFLCLIAVLFIGTGIALNTLSMLGNDSIALFYDGVRVFLNLGMEKFGVVSNCVNFVLFLIVLFTASNYINVGTIIYTVLLGVIINLVTSFYNLINIPFTIATQICLGLFGCTFLFMGVGLFIATNSGLDPVTGFTVMLSEKIKIKFKYFKIIFDIVLIVIGTLLGGKIGVLTIFAALTAGFTIQFFADLFIKLFVRTKIIKVDN